MESYDPNDPAEYLIDRLIAKSRGESINEDLFLEASYLVIAREFVAMGLTKEQAFAQLDRDSTVNARLDRNGSLELELVFDDEDDDG